MYTYMYTVPVKRGFWFSVVLVHPEEWHALLQWFTSENSVTISVMTNLEDNSTTIKTVPGKIVYLFHVL